MSRIKEWWSRTGCFTRVGLLLLLACGGCQVVIPRMDVYSCALPEVLRSPAAAALLGEPLSAGWVTLMPSYNKGYALDGESRTSASFVTTLHGPRGAGVLTVVTSTVFGTTYLRAKLWTFGRATTLVQRGDIRCQP